MAARDYLLHPGRQQQRFLEFALNSFVADRTIDQSLPISRFDFSRTDWWMRNEMRDTLIRRRG
ncbi:hypothetical protein [Bradyrhizobium sp. CB3481]|uniref:hypothetical protein n=1 Tax=Bradyrhizobium sp. CB3481 TaxID=3039158 RepID=UPI0024B12CE5|nr:hypothetical protein [Bradyrhizobium sp. CB3481]WFU14555.1 hypothetical protein QA643_25855 [Bradyrhizobium sp. CB3481]